MGIASPGPFPLAGIQVAVSRTRSQNRYRAHGLSGRPELNNDFQAVRHTVSTMYTTSASLNTVPDNGEPQTGSACLALSREFRPIKRPENILEFIVRQTRAAIRHDDQYLIPLLLCGYFDGPGRARISHRISDVDIKTRTGPAPSFLLAPRS